MHVGFEPPWQRVAAPNNAVLGNGGEEDDVQLSHCHRGLDVRVRVVAFQ